MFAGLFCVGPTTGSPLSWQHTPYNLPLALSTMVSAALVVFIWQRRHNPGARHLFVVMAGVVVWTLFYGLQVAAVPLATKMLCTRIEYLGILTVPTMWLAFALDYTGRGAWLRRNWLWLLPVPMATVLLIWSNPAHMLFFTSAETQLYSDFVVLDLQTGPGFWAHALYCYTLLAVGNVLLLTTLLRSPEAYRGQFAAALTGSLAPWFANVLTIFDVISLPHLDLTPFAFTISGCSLGWGLYRFRLLRLMPLARDAAVELMRDAVLLVDTWGRVVDLNPAARALFASDAQLMGEDALEQMPELSVLFAAGTQRADTEAVLTRKVNGFLRQFQGQMVSLRQADGNTTGNLIVLRDITTQLRQLEKLRELKEAADSASRAKSHFLAHMNHELRNPLTAILGSAELLQTDLQGKMGAEQQRLLEAIRTGGDQLLQMINESLDMARIEAGRTTLFAEAFVVQPLLQELCNNVKGLMEGRGNRLRLQVEEKSTHMVNDQTKLRQCLLNLLANAAKFTEHGEVTLSASRLPRKGGDWLLLSVRDTGIGIETEQLDRIFEPFSQASDSTARHFGGTGLGLAIARNFARLMGGDLEATSTPGEGSEFILSLPLQMDPNRTTTQVKAEDT